MQYCIRWQCIVNQDWVNDWSSLVATIDVYADCGNQAGADNSHLVRMAVLLAGEKGQRDIVHKSNWP